MKKLLCVMAITALFSLVLAGSAFSKEQAMCPVMGGKVNKEIYVDHAGQRVYFCCNMCIDTFKKEPGKYLKKMAADGVVPAKAAAATKQKTGHEGHNHN